MEILFNMLFKMIIYILHLSKTLVAYLLQFHENIVFLCHKLLYGILVQENNTNNACNLALLVAMSLAKKCNLW